MSMISELLEYNKKFVDNKEYEKYITSKLPNKRMVILACMDTRLTELLPSAMNVKNGDAKIIKNAGALVCEPFGSVMRSIVIALYELNAKEVVVVGHKDCGMANNDPDKIIGKMCEKGISEKDIALIQRSGIDVKKWLYGFSNVEESVMATVETIKNHPLIPENVPVHGLIIDPANGELELVIDGTPA